MTCTPPVSPACNVRRVGSTMIESCVVTDSVTPCFGLRTFPRAVPCRWTSGTRWSTVVLLSITLGGFGADRFYLGDTAYACAKLLTLGGLGIWTLIDIMLAVTGHLAPSDGSALMLE